jgi:hypothetical protein
MWSLTKGRNGTCCDFVHPEVTGVATWLRSDEAHGHRDGDRASRWYQWRTRCIRLLTNEP